MKHIVYFSLLIILFSSCNTPISQKFEDTCWEGDGVIVVLGKDHVAFLKALPFTLFDEVNYNKSINEVGRWEYVGRFLQKQIHIEGNPISYSFEVETSLILKNPKCLYYFEGDPDSYKKHKLYPVSCCEVKKTDMIRIQAMRQPNGQVEGCEPEVEYSNM